MMETPVEGEATGFAVGTREAREWASRSLMLSDLDHSLATIGAIISLADTAGDRRIAAIRDSAFRDVIVQFMACFDAGAEPFPLRADEIFSGVAEWKEFFYFLRDIRNTFAAHRSGPSRQCEIAAYILDGSEPPQVLGVGPFQIISTDVDNPEFITPLQKMILLTLRCVELRCAELQKIVEAQVAAMTPEQLRGLKLAALRAPGPQDHKKGREKYHGYDQPRPR